MIVLELIQQALICILWRNLRRGLVTAGLICIQEPAAPNLHAAFASAFANQDEPRTHFAMLCPGGAAMGAPSTGRRFAYPIARFGFGFQTATNRLVQQLFDHVKHTRGTGRGGGGRGEGGVE